MQNSMIGSGEAGARSAAIWRVLTACIAFFIIVLAWLPAADPVAAGADGPPAIHVELAVHEFAPVYEGEPLRHAFRVENRGGKDLHVKEVTSA